MYADYEPVGIAYYIILFYLITVFISYPAIKRSLLRLENEDELPFQMNPLWAARMLAWIPLYNLKWAFQELVLWIGFKITQRKIQKIANKYKGTPTGDGLSYIAKRIGDLASMKDTDTPEERKKFEQSIKESKIRNS